MSSTYTSRLNLEKPAANDLNWDVPVRANCDALDALAPVGGLAVATAEVPSASLNVKVAAGTYRAFGGAAATYAGTSSFAVTTAATNYLFLDKSGTLAKNTTGFPAAPHLRLAVVVAGATTITSVTDSRVGAAMQGDGYTYLAIPNSAVTDANVLAGQVAVWVNESTNNLTFRVRYSTGTYKTGTVALT